MRALIRTLGTVAIVSGLLFCTPTFAQHEHDEGTGHSHALAEAHGGASTMSKEFHFETVFHQDAVMIYVYDGSQKPMDASGLTGTIDMQFKDKSRESLQAKLEYVAGGSDEVGYLRGSLDLDGVADQAAKAKVEIHGLSGRDEKDVSYRETFRLATEGDDDDHGDDHGGGHGHE